MYIYIYLKLQYEHCICVLYVTELRMPQEVLRENHDEVQRVCMIMDNMV